LPQNQQDRAQALVGIFSCLDNVGKSAFKEMLFVKKGIQLLVAMVLNNESSDDEDADKKKREQCIQMIAKYCVATALSDQKKFWAAVNKAPAEKVMKLLKTALKPDSTFANVVQCKANAAEKNIMGDNSEQAQFLRDIVQRTSHTIVTAETVIQLLDECDKAVTEDVADNEQYILDRLALLEHIAQFYTYLFDNSLEKLQSMLNTENKRILDALLRVVLYAFDKLEERETQTESQVALYVSIAFN
jgi:hypothetical protein